MGTGCGRVRMAPRGRSGDRNGPRAAYRPCASAASPGRAAYRPAMAREGEGRRNASAEVGTAAFPTRRAADPHPGEGPPSVALGLPTPAEPAGAKRAVLASRQKSIAYIEP